MGVQFSKQAAMPESQMLWIYQFWVCAIMYLALMKLESLEGVSQHPLTV